MFGRLLFSPVVGSLAALGARRSFFGFGRKLERLSPAEHFAKGVEHEKLNQSLAEKHLVAAAEQSHIPAFGRLALLKQSSDMSAAVQWAKKGALLRDPTSLAFLGHKLVSEGNTTEGLKYLEESCTPSALFDAGVVYLQGQKVPQDLTKAVTLLSKSAAMDHTEALMVLSDVYLGEFGVPADLPKSLELLSKAAELGDVRACHLAGARLLADSNASSEAVSLGIKLLETACSHGVADAEFALASFLASHSEGGSDQSRIMQLMNSAAEKQHTGAQIFLANCFFNGIGGLEADITQGMKWVRNAAQLGHPDAQAILGSTLLSGANGLFPPHAEEAVFWLQKAAEQGSARGQYFLSECLRHGRGLPKNEAASLSYLLKAVESGWPFALYALSLRQSVGAGVVKDLNAAYANALKAAEAGVAEAMTQVAIAQANGLGVTKDLDSSITYLQRAAALNESTAQLLLGNHFMLGVGVPKNPSRAAELFRLAADAGRPQAMLWFGICLMEGEGVPQDLNEAKRWLDLAKEHGIDVSQHPMQLVNSLGKPSA